MLTKEGTPVAVIRSVGITGAAAVLPCPQRPQVRGGLLLSEVYLGVDGCTAVCFPLPLQAMARAWAHLGTSAPPTRPPCAAHAAPTLHDTRAEPTDTLRAAGTLVLR